VKEAIRRYKEALRINPNYDAAYAGLADSYIMLANHHNLPPREGYLLGRTAAERELSIDESLAEFHTFLVWIHRLFDWDWPAAERESLRAVQLNPGHAFGRIRYALLLSGMGRQEEAGAEAQRAHGLDPLNRLTYTVVGDTLFYARRYERSVASYCLELDPSFGAAPTDLARSLEQVGGPTKQSKSSYGELRVPMAAADLIRPRDPLCARRAAGQCACHSGSSPSSGAETVRLALRHRLLLRRHRGQ
jgi:tetratricopeptide (TPR) repeat protein